MGDFNGKLSKLCTEAMREAKNRPEMQAEIVERLINATAFSIAMMCKGQKKPMDQLLAGAEQQLYEAAAGHKDAAQFLASL